MAILTTTKIEAICTEFSSDSSARWADILTVINRIASAVGRTRFSAVMWDVLTCYNMRNRYSDLKNEIREFYEENRPFSSGSCLFASGVGVKMLIAFDGENI
jgi:hypothetical protein